MWSGGDVVVGCPLGLGHIRHVAGQRLQVAGHRPAVGPVDQLDGVGDGQVHAASQLRDAADVAGGHQIRPHTLDVGDLALAKLPGERSARTI